MTNDFGETARHAVERAGEKLSEARDQAYHAASVAREQVENAYGTARTKAGEAYEATRTKANAAAQTTRRAAEDASRKTAKGVEENPLIALAGGLAFGALLAAILPRTERETKTLGAVGRKINKKASDTVNAARKAGTDEFKAAKTQVTALVDKAMSATKSGPRKRG